MKSWQRLRLRPGERRPTVLAASLLFFIMAALILLKAARDGLVLGAYPAEALPYFIAVSLMFSLFTVYAFQTLMRWVSLIYGFLLTLAVFIVGTLLLTARVGHERDIWLVVLYIWVGIYATLAPVQAWLAVSRCFAPRQARRLIGWVVAGGITGSIVGGSMARALVTHQGVKWLLPAAAVGMALSMVLCYGLRSPPAGLEEVGVGRKPARIRRRFVLLLLGLVALGTLISTFADFQFKIISQAVYQARFPLDMAVRANALAGFFGSFYAILGVLTLAFQVILVPLLLRRWSVGRNLLLYPVALGLGNGLVFFGSLFPPLRLASGAFLKGGDQLFKHSLYRSALEVLYTAFPENVRVQLKARIDALGDRAAEIVAAGLLIVLFSWLRVPVPGLAGFSLLLVMVAVGVARSLHREYPRTLADMIRRQEVDYGAIRQQLLRSGFHRYLPVLFENASKASILRLLDLIDNSGNPHLGGYLSPLLQHPDPQVRLRALQVMFMQEEDLSEAVAGLVSDRSKRIRIKAVRYLCLHSRASPAEKLVRFMEEPDPVVRAAAAVCALNMDHPEIQRLSQATLNQLMDLSFHQHAADIRVEIAHILEDFSPTAEMQSLLRRLLQDTHVEVQAAALQTVARLQPLELIPDLIDRFHAVHLHRQVREALVSYGLRILPRLHGVMEDPNQSMVVKRQVLKVMAEIGGTGAIWMLLTTASGRDESLRERALAALNTLQRRVPLDGFRSSLEGLVEQEQAVLVRLRSLWDDLNPDPGSLLHRFLQYRMKDARTRLFRALALVYDPESIRKAWFSIEQGARRRAEAGLELLEATLEPHHRSTIPPLLEKGNGGRPKAADGERRKQAILKLLECDDELLAAACIMALERGELEAWRDLLRSCVDRCPGTGLVRETWEWRWMTMKKSSRLGATRRFMSTIQKMDYLSRLDVFSHLGPEELLLLAAQSERVEFPAGEVVYRSGDPGVAIFSVVRGVVELLGNQGEVQQVRDGDSFGTLAVLAGEVYQETATAREPTLCLRLDRDVFWEIVEDHPTIYRGILQTLSRNLVALQARLGALSQPASSPTSDEPQAGT